MKMFNLVVATLVFSTTIHAYAAEAASTNQGEPANYAIKHLEPLSWWVGMKNPQLQLMVHGEQLADLEPQINYPGVKLLKVERTNNRNYLFIDLAISPATKPGEITIGFTRNQQLVTQVKYLLAAREPNSAARRGFDARDAIYLITPDRFANGDPGNDTLPGMSDSANRQDPVARHGGDLAGMTKHLDYIAKLGFTQIWPTPLLENNQPSYSYHGYALTDYYQVDKRFGSNEDFRRYVQEANKRGLGVIQDIVLNHIGTGHWWMQDLPTADWINYPPSASPSGKKTAAFVQTNNQHSTVQDMHAAPEELQLFQDGWFVDSMPDLNQRNPLVARYLIQNTLWWIEYAHLSGIREDTYSYADSQFLRDWCHAILSEYPQLNIVGEEMQDDPARVAYWQKGALNRDGYDSGLPSLMDFPVVDAMPNILNARESYGSGFIKLYEIIALDFLYANPMNLMLFPDNHDRSRIFSLLHENLDLLKTDLLFVATTRGIPQIYYGTEVLMTSPIERDDGLLRADFPGGWAGDKINAFTGKGLSDQQQDMQQFVQALFNWRKTNKAISEGKLLHYIPRDGVYVYFRYTDSQRVMVVLNKNSTDTQLDLSRFRAALKGKTTGKNIITGQQLDLGEQLPLKAMTSVVLEL